MVLTTTLLTRIRDDTLTTLGTLFLFGAVGDDGTTPTVGDTTLGNEVFRKAIEELDTTVPTAITASLRLTTTEANGFTIRETGWLDLITAGNLWTHDLLTGVNKTSDINLFLDTTITVTVVEDFS